MCVCENISPESSQNRPTKFKVSKPRGSHPVIEYSGHESILVSSIVWSQVYSGHEYILVMVVLVIGIYYWS